MVAKARVASHQDTIICGTRYGNVMASRGSVIPLFINQILAGQPLTITDPSMTRFMMSIEDAVDLGLYAFQNGNPGDIFVQKAPAATILDLAVAFKQPLRAPIIRSRSSARATARSCIETLLNREERAKAEDCGNYFRIPADIRDLNYNVYFTEGKQEVSLQEDYNSHNTDRLDVDGLVELLHRLDYVQAELATWHN